MSDFVDRIFARINNSSSGLNPIEFKEFYDLTASGMNAPMLDSKFIMSQFNQIRKAQPNIISRIEMQDYVRSLYKAIIAFSYTCYGPAR